MFSDLWNCRHPDRRRRLDKLQPAPIFSSGDGQGAADEPRAHLQREFTGVLHPSYIYHVNPRGFCTAGDSAPHQMLDIALSSLSTGWERPFPAFQKAVQQKQCPAFQKAGKGHVQPFKRMDMTMSSLSKGCKMQFPAF